MQVSNTEWERAGDATPAKLIVQNVGNSRIAFVFSASQPDVLDIVMDAGDHFVLMPGGNPLTIAGLDTDAVSMWVRALGPTSAELMVS